MSFDVVDVAENGWGLMPALVTLRREVTPELILLDQPGWRCFAWHCGVPAGARAARLLHCRIDRPPRRSGNHAKG
jgi:hypothetical protein